MYRVKGVRVLGFRVYRMYRVKGFRVLGFRVYRVRIFRV